MGPVCQRTSLGALNAWHLLTWYTVEDHELYNVHSLGVKPGDSLADLIFACCSARFHKHLLLESEGASLVVMIPASSPLPTAQQPHPLQSFNLPAAGVPGVSPDCQAVAK